MIASRFDAICPGPGIRFGIRINPEYAAVSGVDFLPPETPLQDAVLPLAQRACDEIAAYLADPQHCFSIPTHATGTPFRQRVWAAIAAIPCGEVRSYRDLALALNSAPRAVGGACGANPLPLIVPCHRVVALSGIGGFSGQRDGWLIDFKRWLLAHEGVSARG